MLSCKCCNKSHWDIWNDCCHKCSALCNTIKQQAVADLTLFFSNTNQWKKSEVDQFIGSIIGKAVVQIVHDGSVWADTLNAVYITNDWSDELPLEAYNEIGNRLLAKPTITYDEYYNFIRTGVVLGVPSSQVQSLQLKVSSVATLDNLRKGILIDKSRTNPYASNVSLQNGEQLWGVFGVDVHQVVKHTSRSYAGASARIFKGFWIHSGSSTPQSYSVRERVDSGKLFITSMRLVFVGNKSWTFWKGKIASTEAFSDGFVVCRESVAVNNTPYMFVSQSQEEMNATLKASGYNGAVPSQPKVVKNVSTELDELNKQQAALYEKQVIEYAKLAEMLRQKAALNKDNPSLAAACIQEADGYAKLADLDRRKAALLNTSTPEQPITTAQLKAVV